MKFVGLVGSNYDQSYNRKLLEFIRRHFKLKFELEVLEIDEVPMFNQDEKWDESFQLRYLYNKITRADGVIIAPPEHNHTITASIKSVLEWLSYGIHPLLNKPVMITGASYGTLGSSRAQLQLRQILDSPELKANVMPGSEFLLSHSLQAFDKKGDLIDLDTIKKLDALFDDFRLFVKITQKLRSAQDLLHKEAENFDWENI